MFFKLFKKKPVNILIECTDGQVKINDIDITYITCTAFTTLDNLILFFGKPEVKKREKYDTVLFWKKLGIECEANANNHIRKISFPKNKDLKQLFTGVIIVNNKNITSLSEQETNLNEIILFKNDEENFIVRDYNYRGEIPKDKYEIKKLDEEIINFKDFGFKLAVIGELMYGYELLSPNFKLAEFVLWYKKRKIDLEEEGYEQIQEVTQYFKDIQIPKRLAKNITEIEQDSGGEIYLNLIYFGNGTEDYWNIKSIEDIKHFPNLERMILAHAETYIETDLEKAGIKTEWV